VHKTVAKKMHVKPGMTVGFFNAPEKPDHLLGGVSGNVKIKKPSENQELDWILGFIKNRTMLQSKLELLKRSITPDGVLWIVYHKASSLVDN